MLCRLCGDNATRFLELGIQPLANRFLTEAMLSQAQRVRIRVDGNLANRYLTEPMVSQPEPLFWLEEFFCKSCYLVQLGTVPEPKEQFSNYAYASSTSASFRKHFELLADKVCEHGVNPGDLVVDIGSNDGVLLAPLEARSVQAIGIEPAENLCAIARQGGMDVRHEFFGQQTVRAVGFNSAKAITAFNVFAHVPELRPLIRNIYDLLTPDGVFIAEVQSMKAMLDTLLFDNCYSEHVFTWSIISISRALAQFGLRVFRVEQIPTHGGSLRVFADKSHRVPEASVVEALAEEMGAGLGQLETYQAFAQQVQDIKTNLKTLLEDLHAQGNRIVGYGAPAKSSTINSFVGIDTRLVEYIVDDSPLKQGLYTPGSHIPVRNPEALKTDRPDYLLVYAWNFFEPIHEKTRHMRIPYILPIPPRIVQP